MTSKRTILYWQSLLLLVSMSVLATCHSDPFANLGFDEGQIPQGPSGTASEMLPGWNISMGEWMVYNVPRDFYGAATLYDGTSPWLPHYPLVGKFGLALYPQASRDNPSLLIQSGSVPSGTPYLDFVYTGPDVRVYVNQKEQPIIMTGPLPSGDPLLPQYTHMGVDLTPYAGAEVELRFEFRQNLWKPHDSAQQVSVIDGLRFGVIPEPSTFALLGFGGMGLGWWLRRRR